MSIELQSAIESDMAVIYDDGMQEYVDYVDFTQPHEEAAAGESIVDNSPETEICLRKGLARLSQVT